MLREMQQAGRPAPPDAPQSSGEPSGPRVIARARLLETPHCTIDWDDERGLVRFARTALPHSRLADVAREGILVQRTLDKTGRARLLVDLRALVLRSDVGFEAANASFRRKLFHGGERMAILVGTAVGLIQAKRHLREDGFQAEVFSREEDALAFFGPRPSR